MYLNILKKDLKRKKAMNIILLMFIILKCVHKDYVLSDLEISIYMLFFSLSHLIKSFFNN